MIWYTLIFIICFIGMILNFCIKDDKKRHFFEVVILFLSQQKKKHWARLPVIFSFSLLWIVVTVFSGMITLSFYAIHPAIPPPQ